MGIKKRMKRLKGLMENVEGAIEERLKKRDRKHDTGKMNRRRG